MACLKDKAYYQRIGREVEVQRRFIYSELKKLGFSYSETVTNFLLVDVKKDSTQLANQLLKKGVIVRDMAFWGLKNYIRVTIGTPAENKQFLQALANLK